MRRAAEINADVAQVEDRVVRTGENSKSSPLCATFKVKLRYLKCYDLM